MIEILVVMIISGIVIGLTFEGVDIFRRYSGKITAEMVKSSELFNTYTSLNTVLNNSDSLTAENDSVKLHRKGAVFGKMYILDSKLILDILNNTDSLPVKAESINVRPGISADTLLVETETIGLMFYTKERTVITTEKNNYNEPQNY